MIETHAHLDFDNFDEDRETLIKSCKTNGVKFIVNIGVDLETSKASIDLAEKYDFVFASVGYHPHDSKDFTEDIFNKIKDLSSHPKVVAIGEIGLDYFHDHSPRDIQREVFIKQLDLADEIKKPVVLHIREALDDAYDILRKRQRHQGVLHAFPGDSKYAAEGIEMGYHIAFGGTLTYPKSNRPEVAVSVPLSRIVTETDCPFLPPQKYRGKRNQPDYIKYVIEKLAEIFPKYSYTDIERITEKNAGRLFKLPVDDTPEIVYTIGDSIYINLTMRCTNNCYFCVKNKDNHVAGHNLLLNDDPSEDEILAEIEKHSDYKEIVFCGLGEPTLRADVMLSLAQRLKTKGVPIRLDTNGQGSMINKADLPSEMKGLIDSVSISLNAENVDIYKQICRPQFGANAFKEITRFASRCKELGFNTQLSVVSVPQIDIDKCRRLASRMGIPLRIRKYVTI